ncbi:MAG: hypothetical protein RL033_3676 [Pseudomonadota bacterium]|jgi:hypothetical protein
MIDDGRLGEARQQLDLTANQPADLLELLRLKLKVAERQLEPARALESVLTLLVADPHHPAALELYRELSLKQYSSGNSCLSNSHPPPPPRSR